MVQLNLPWVESPFFESELNKRGSLSNSHKEAAQFFNKNGYLILRAEVQNELIDSVRNDLENNLKNHFTEGDPRVMNMWRHSEAIKNLANLEAVNEVLKMLYGRNPIPFQTLNFSHGSQQKAHSDTIHFNSLPERYMAAAWVALEDMDEDNGTVTYYPGSHKLPIYDYSHISSKLNIPEELDDRFYMDHYEPLIAGLMKTNNIEAKTLTIKKGDILIWSANLIHGGLPVKDKSRTRWSQVTHYFFEDCLYYTPQLSNPVTGDYFIRKIQNIKTGKDTWGSYNGQKVKRKISSHYRFLISKDASYGWRDVLFVFKRIYYKLFVRSK